MASGRDARERRSCSQENGPQGRQGLKRPEALRGRGTGEDMEFHTAGVIGGGAWGTALAQSAAAAGLAVILQAGEPEVVQGIRAGRMNDAFLPGVELDSAINVTSDLADLADCDLILAVPPAQHMRATLTAFAPYARPGVPIILCSKGIE